MKKNKVLKAFLKDFKDDELQERWNRNSRKANELNSRLKELTKEMKELKSSAESIKQNIAELALEGIISVEANERYYELEERIVKLYSKANEFKSILKEEERQMNQLERLSDCKLFTWWQAIRAVDKKTAPWLEWKRDYDNKIF